MVNFAVLSDVHYISLDMIRDREYFERVNAKTYDTIILRHHLAKKALQQVGDSDVKTVLFIGDLTDDGDVPSTNEMVALLRELKNKGKNVYVITATHDFHHNRVYCRKHPHNYIFKEDVWDSPYFNPEGFDYRSLLRPHYKHLSDEDITLQFAPAVYESDLWNIYSEFRPQKTISVLESDQSYCFELDDDHWCLMLYDCFRHTDALYNDSPSFTPKALNWIANICDMAKKKGKFLFACTHHSMVPPQPAYKIGATPRDMRDPDVGHFLADHGINLIFTGHSHMCDVGFGTSEKGNIICDIGAPSCSMFPPQYRVVELDGKKGRVKTEMVDILMPEGMDFGGKTPYEVLKKDKFDTILYDLADKNPSLYNLVTKVRKKLKVKHLSPFFRRVSKMKAAEYKAIKNISIVDLVFECAANLLTGDGCFTPDTPQYKALMGFAATMDSILDAQPFFDLKRKVLKGYSLWDILEPMMFNNYVPDGDNDFDFTVLPQQKYDVKKYKTHAGAWTMFCLWLLLIVCSPFAILAALIGFPIMCLKKRNNKKPQKKELPIKY